MLTCRELAEKWNVTDRAVAKLCKAGKIPGAKKIGKSWQIPEGTERPADGRITSGRYIKKYDVGVALKEEPFEYSTEIKGDVANRLARSTRQTEVVVPVKKNMPIGISDYVRAQADYYYVDKTLMIKEFLDKKPLVSLFTRPRRFGKTLNMDMLRVFFEKTNEDTSVYFRDKAIWKCGEEYRRYQGKYPVIFLTFKDVKFDSWEATRDKIKGILQAEFSRHVEVLKSKRIADYEVVLFKRILSGEASEVEMTSSLEILSKILFERYGVAPVVIIDEYDTPIQEGYNKGFYEEVVGFMRNFFSGVFKDNRYLSYGFLTGVLRIAQESIFSGMNNLVVNSVMENEYAEHFGFTYGEIHRIAKDFGILGKEVELREWYDGYVFGSENIYNPWSVVNYISRGCMPQAYWVNTGKNEVIGDILKIATEDIYGKIQDLVTGKSVVVRIDENVVYGSIASDPENVFSLLLVAGYLRIDRKELQSDGTFLCEVSIPNKEIAAVYTNEIMLHLLQIGAVSKATANRIAESLYAKEIGDLQKAIREYLDASVSFYDSGAEGFYHGLVLGLVALMDNQYEIKSNRESGDGRYDICMMPRKSKYPGIIMELKNYRSGAKVSAKDVARGGIADRMERAVDRMASDVDGTTSTADRTKMQQLAHKALEQIDNKSYDSELRLRGVGKILKIGIAFSGKHVEIASNIDDV